MAKPLLYQPRQRWRVAIAFGAAAVIHCTAIAIAGRYGTIEAIAGQEEFTTIDVIDPALPANEATPPPIEETSSTLLPKPSEEPIFEENRPTPPPVRRQPVKLAAPTTKRSESAPPGMLNLPSARATALTAPRPEYPYEARRQRITGSGIVVMRVDSATGRVANVSMAESTGSPVLDNAAVAAFTRWRFKPGTVSRVRSPITFTLTGAQY
ncbi:MAG TPA: TonB family protein [Chthoniobacterales bacterium]|nr:TonB family protein [Chthoniobacterales bacterium]